MRSITSRSRITKVHFILLWNWQSCVSRQRQKSRNSPTFWLSFWSATGFPSQVDEWRRTDDVCPAEETPRKSRRGPRWVQLDPEGSGWKKSARNVSERSENGEFGERARGLLLSHSCFMRLFIVILLVCTEIKIYETNDWIFIYFCDLADWVFKGLWSHQRGNWSSWTELEPQKISPLKNFKPFAVEEGGRFVSCKSLPSYKEITEGTKTFASVAALIIPSLLCDKAYYPAVQTKSILIGQRSTSADGEFNTTGSSNCVHHFAYSHQIPPALCWNLTTVCVCVRN